MFRRVASAGGCFPGFAFSPTAWAHVWAHAGDRYVMMPVGYLPALHTSTLLDGALAFVARNFHKVQAGRGVKAPGTPEIPVAVFEELLVNALVHRDHLVSAPIRLFIFNDRIEILSPGRLPNRLTVAKIRRGNPCIRNPILVSYLAKGLLPYHGLGSGIARPLAQWARIDPSDHREGCLSTATVRRLAPGSERGSVKSSEVSSEKTADQILERLANNRSLTVRELAS